MKLLFKQRIFSWLDSYDIFSETQELLFTVRGRLNFGHCLEIYDEADRQVGLVQEKVLSFLPRFVLYEGDCRVGEIRKELTLFRPSFQITCNGWRVEGDVLEWNYQITDTYGGLVATVEKMLFNFSDTYEINVRRREDVLMALMVVLAIDAAKCSKN